MSNELEDEFTQTLASGLARSQGIALLVIEDEAKWDIKIRSNIDPKDLMTILKGVIERYEAGNLDSTT